jgi:hypothetical protein
MDKVGGIDNYLLKTADKKIDSVRGLKIKQEMLMVLQEKQNKEQELNLVKEEEEVLQVQKE